MDCVVEEKFNGLAGRRDNFLQFRVLRGGRLYSYGRDALGDFAR